MVDRHDRTNCQSCSAPAVTCGCRGPPCYSSS